MLTTALRPSSNCKLCTPSSVTQSPPFLLVASTSTHLRPVRAGLFWLNDMLSSTRLKPFCSSQLVFTSMDPDIAPVSPGGCSGHDPVLAPGSPAARKRKPRRLHEEGAVGVATMIGRHDSICGSAAWRGKIRHRRPWPRIDQVALGINRRWQERGAWLALVGASSIASRYSLWIRGIPVLGNGSRRRVPCCPCLESHLALERPSMQTIQKNQKKLQQPQPGLKQSGPEK